VSIRSATCDVIIAGDFNAKHRAWGSRMNDDKGESLNEFAYSLGLTVCNQGNKPTWQRENSESYIDVTMVSANLVAKVINWHVLDEYSHSDHNYIEYSIEDIVLRPRKGLTRRNFRNMEQNKLENAITRNTSEVDIGVTANDGAVALKHALMNVMDEVAPNMEITAKRKSVYWWSPHIKQLRKTSNHLRHVYTRKRRRADGDACAPEKEALRIAKLELTKAIKKSKENAWRELCCMVESDPWGKPYKLVMGKLCKKLPIPGIDTPGRIENIVEGLFPTHHKRGAVI